MYLLRCTAVMNNDRDFNSTSAHIIYYYYNISSRIRTSAYLLSSINYYILCVENVWRMIIVGYFNYWNCSRLWSETTAETRLAYCTDLLCTIIYGVCIPLITSCSAWMFFDLFIVFYEVRVMRSTVVHYRRRLYRDDGCERVRVLSDDVCVR